MINGIDTATNGHDSGTRNTGSGKLQEGYPAFNALYAAAVAHDRPMAYITNGGYDHTMGLLAPTRVGNVSAVQRLAFPNMPDVNKPELVFHSESTRLRIQKARDERLQRQIAKAFTAHLLRFALARELGPVDTLTIDHIVSQAESSDYNLQTLIREVIRSQSFQNN